MRITDIGSLVRPRVLTHVYLYPLFPHIDLQAKPNTNVDHWWKTVRNYYKYLNSLQKEQLTKTYGNTDSLFEELKLGDTAKDISTAYVGKVVSLIVQFHGTFFHISSLTQGKVFEDKIKKSFGPNTKLRVFAVGLKFFKGMSLVDNALTPINPWEPVVDDTKIWFYSPKHIVSIHDIMRFEQVDQGDLVLFTKSSGMAVNVVTLSKPKFYNTNSWTPRSIRLLSGNKLAFIRFLPDRLFSIKSKDREEQW